MKCFSQLVLACALLGLGRAQQQCVRLDFWQTSKGACADCIASNQDLCHTSCYSLAGTCAVNSNAEVNTENPKRPSCAIVPGRQGRPARVVGYYEGWNAYRPCTNFDHTLATRPPNIKPWMYTHLNFAFAHIHPSTFEIAMAHKGDRFLYRDLVFLKEFNKDLKVYISITPWDMYHEGSDGKQSTFSSLVGSEKYQKKFFKSLKAFIKATGFDGVDVYWPYPGVEAHGGRIEDYDNFSVFIHRLREALETNDKHRSGLTVTLPLNHERIQGFDLKQLEPHVEFFNTVPLKPSDAVKTVAEAMEEHRSPAKAGAAFDKFWEQGIPPEKVTLALSLSVHTFHLSNALCDNASCELVGRGPPADCSSSVGKMWRSEAELFTRAQNPWHASSSEDRDHSYQIGFVLLQNTPELLHEYVELAKSLCLGGVSVWGGVGDRLMRDGDTTADRLGESLGMHPADSSAPYNDYTAFSMHALTRYLDFAHMGVEGHPHQSVDSLVPAPCNHADAKSELGDAAARLCVQNYKYNYKKVVPEASATRDVLGYGSGRGHLVTVPPHGHVLAANSTEQCSKWHIARAGETCRSLLAAHDMDLSLLVAANPSLAARVGDADITANSCSDALVPGRAYCVMPMDLFDLPYKEVGCYYSINGQVMGSPRDRKYFANRYKNMSPRVCANMCEENTNDRRSIVFGLENGDRCYCERGIYFDSSKVKQKYCNKPCTGLPSAMCGGKKYTSVYVAEEKADEPLVKFTRGDAKSSLGGPSFGHGKRGCGKADPWQGFAGMF